MALRELPPEFWQLRRWLNEQVANLGDAAALVTAAFGDVWSGVEDFFGSLEDIPFSVDTDAIRDRATRVWGVSADHADATGGRLVEVLQRLGLESRSTGPLAELTESWKGTGADAFETRLVEIAHGLQHPGDTPGERGEYGRFPIVGDALLAVADAFELAWEDAMNAFQTWWGVCSAAAGLAVAAVAAEVVLGIAAAVMTLIALVALVFSMQQKRIAALNKFAERLPLITSPTPEVGW